VRRVTIKNDDGRTLIETDCTIEVERTDRPDDAGDEADPAGDAST
jgi:hypothetical protein